MESRIRILEEKVDYLENQLKQIQAALFEKQQDQSSAVTSTHTNETADERKFKTTIKSISNGLNVPVHELRKKLGWKHSFFDEMIQSLIHKNRIILEHGDMLHLNIRDLNDSYVNDKGETFTRISWKEK